MNLPAFKYYCNDIVIDRLFAVSMVGELNVTTAEEVATFRAFKRPVDGDTYPDEIEVTILLPTGPTPNNPDGDWR